MAGKAGRSGGVRPGAGAKKREPVVAYDDPKAFLADVMNNAKTDARLRVDAAKALMPYLHQKKGENGKKGERQAAANRVAAGKFAPAAPPKLVVNNSK